MKLVQTRQFKQAVKKLTSKQKEELDKAIKTIINNPFIGQQKKGTWIFCGFISFV
jgi:hypothetical protein